MIIQFLLTCDCDWVWSSLVLSDDVDEAEPIPFVFVLCFFLTCPLLLQFVDDGDKLGEFVIVDGIIPLDVLFCFCLLSSNERFSSKCW